MLRKQSQNGVRADGDEERGRHGLGPQRRGADSASGPQSVGFAKVYPVKVRARQPAGCGSAKVLDAAVKVLIGASKAMAETGDVAGLSAHLLGVRQQHPSPACGAEIAMHAPSPAALVKGLRFYGPNTLGGERDTISVVYEVIIC